MRIRKQSEFAANKYHTFSRRDCTKSAPCYYLIQIYQHTSRSIPMECSVGPRCFTSDSSMYAAKDSMNLPVKKSRTPLPSSPTPNLLRPAGTKRHHGEGTDVRSTDFLLDRNKRSPQNEPRILDHVGSQNKTQQIIGIVHPISSTVARLLRQLLWNRASLCATPLTLNRLYQTQA